MTKINKAMAWNEVDGSKCFDELHETPVWVTVNLI
jgi:hypothetical protein